MPEVSLKTARLSVVTVCKNSGRTIAETFASLQKQKYVDYEYIVVDGGSTDDTLEIIERFSDLIDVFISGPDAGLYDAMNKGLSKACGEWICFLNSDDYYSCDDALQKLMDELERTGADSVYADAQYVDINGRPLRHYDSGPFSRVTLRYGFMPAHPTFIGQTEFIRELGGYDLQFKIGSDFDLICRYFHNTDKTFSYVSCPLVNMRDGGVSNSSWKSKLQIQLELKASLMQLGLKTSHLELLKRFVLKLPGFWRHSILVGALRRMR